MIYHLLYKYIIYHIYLYLSWKVIFLNNDNLRYFLKMGMRSAVYKFLETSLIANGDDGGLVRRYCR